MDSCKLILIGLLVLNVTIDFNVYSSSSIVTNVFEVSTSSVSLNVTILSEVRGTELLSCARLCAHQDSCIAVNYGTPSTDTKSTCQMLQTSPASVITVPPGLTGYLRRCGKFD